MNKYLKILVIICIAIVITWVLGRVTGALQYFRAPTAANEPAIKTGSKFFGSNLIAPEKLDFICFYKESAEYGRHIVVYRLCATEGDIVEIKDGILFVNNNNIDAKLSLTHFYFIKESDRKKIEELIELDENMVFPISEDTINLPLPDDFVLKNKINARRLVTPKGEKDEEIYKAFSKNWNLDNFGPVTVPKDKYFVLGDNRHNAADSRFIGFVDKKDVIATVLWRK